MAKIRLTDEQINKKNWLIEQMGDNFKDIDLPLVEALAFAIDRVEFMDSRINDIPALLSDKVFMSSRDKFVRQFVTGLKMLDITPQARAKKQAEVVKEVDPLTELIGDM